MTALVVALAILAFFFFIFAASAIKIVQPYQRGVKERLGKYQETLDPGLRVIIPFIDKIRMVDMREQVVDVPPQEVITSDNVIVSVDAVIYYEPTDPQRLVYNVANFFMAITKLAQTNLRNLIGDMDLDSALTSRDQINLNLRQILDEATDKWGVRVARVEIQRTQASDLDDLNTWRARLLGKPHWDRDKADEAVGNVTVDLSDQASILQRLDALYTKLGITAVQLSLPQTLSASRQAAVAAAKELSQAREALAHAEQASQVSLHDAAVLHQGAKLSLARTLCEEAQKRADFASLVLGRDCVEHGFIPPGVKSEFEECVQLRRRLATT